MLVVVVAAAAGPAAVGAVAAAVGLAVVVVVAGGAAVAAGRAGSVETSTSTTTCSCGALQFGDGCTMRPRLTIARGVRGSGSTPGARPRSGGSGYCTSVEVKAAEDSPAAFG